MPKQNVQSLLVPQWVQSYPLAEDYGANDDDYGENIGDITGYACIVNDQGVWVATTANRNAQGPANGVVLRSERTGLRYGDTNSRTEKGTAVSVQHQGFCPSARAGAAIVKGNVITIDATGKFIPGGSFVAPAAAADASDVRTALINLVSAINTERRLMVTAIAVEAAGAEDDFLSLFLV